MLAATDATHFSSVQRFTIQCCRRNASRRQYPDSWRHLAFSQHTCVTTTYQACLHCPWTRLEWHFRRSATARHLGARGPRQLCLGQLHVEILWYHTSNDSRLCGRMLCQTKRTKLVATKPETEWNGGNRDSVSQDSKTQALTSQDDRDTMKMNWLKKCPGMSRQGKFAM